MKKYILPLLFLFLLSSCENEQLPDNTGYGNIRLSITAEQEVSVTTREATAAQLADYTLTIMHSGTLVLKEKYSDIKWNGEEGTISLLREEDYTIAAESCSEEEAESANDDWGKARIAGISSPFKVRIGETTPVSLACTMQNAKVSVTFDTEELAASNITGYTLTVFAPSNPKRKLVFNADTPENQCAYFNTGDSQLTYLLDGKRENKNIHLEGTIPSLAARQWYKLKVTVTSSGTLTLAVTVDNSVTEEEKENPINPYI